LRALSTVTEIEPITSYVTILIKSYAIVRRSMYATTGPRD